MKVVFAIPALTGEVKVRCHQSLVATYRILTQAGIAYDELFIENCPYLSTARNTLEAMFMDDLEATDLFFVDSDVKFDPMGAIKILGKPQGIVAGIYPLKRDLVGYPVEPQTVDGIPIGQDGLIEANFLPTGFMRVKRIVFENLRKSYPQLRYEQSVVEVLGAKVSAAYDLFGMGTFGHRFTTEDYAFCQRWRDIGGHLWVYPNIDFEHVGVKAYRGNYHEFLLRCPGGAKAPESKISKALQIGGWMSPEELEWLATQAEKHSSIVEIGSWLGRSTRALAQNTSGTVVAVDTWDGSPEHQEAVASLPPGALFGAFQKHMADLQNIIAVRKPSIEAAKEPGEFDMVFIDGAHDYESVKADIQAWKSHLKAGGLLCGHDYNWPGVKQALTELLPEAQQVPGTSIWYV